MPTADNHFAATFKRLGGDKDLFRELVAFFREDAPQLLMALQTGLTAGTADSVQRAAHSLRGLIANFDAERAMNIARLIEESASKGMFQDIPAMLVELRIEVEDLQRILDEYTAQSSVISSRR
jgi:HPt (histidine-containing phosphotransfer) domain-containing protein